MEAKFLSLLWYDTVYLSSMVGLCLGFSTRIAGKLNVPNSGAALLVANHQSFLDPMVVGSAVRRRLAFLARKTLFKHPLMATILRNLDTVPIDQEGVGKDGIRTIEARLQAGKAVLVFPEGRRTANGAMQPLKPGIHLLIKRSLAPVIPVGIAGAYEAWPIWRPYPIFAPIFWPASKRTIAAVFGKPLDAKHFAAMSREEALQALDQEIRKVQLEAEKLRRKSPESEPRG